VFTHVLVPLDLGARHGRALDMAAEIARRDGARVTLLHVIQRVEHIPPAELRRFYAGLQRTAERRLARAQRRVARGNTRTRTVVVVGRPAHDIVRYAARNAVDLIVMTSHPVDSRRDPRAWGTTSYKVGILCRCPVMLVK
jgi:nucleotide-binding universal stress UspA family protein